MSPVDVAVVGGGITGITAALLLARSGRRVAVVEARRIGKGETGKTTAHLTEALDVPLPDADVALRRRGGARLAAAGQRAAIERIATFADECAIDVRLPARVRRTRSPRPKAERAVLEREAAAARKLGVAAALVDGRRCRSRSPARCASTTRPRSIRGCTCRGWSARSSAMHGQIFEDTQVVAIDGGRAVPGDQRSRRDHRART